MKDYKRDEIKKYADLILKELSSENSLILSQFENNNPFVSKHNSTVHEVMNYLLMNGYVEFHQGRDQDDIYNNEDGSWTINGEYTEKVSITELGIQIREKGGILKSEKDLKNEKCRKEALDWFGIGGGILGLLSALFTVLIYFGVIDKESQSDNEILKIDSINHKIDLMEKKQIKQNQNYLRHIDSLQNIIKNQ